MSWQELGALGEAVGGIGVILSLIYVAYQIRQSSHQIEQNSRHIEASAYASTNQVFTDWQSMLAENEDLARIWLRAHRGEEFEGEEQVRFNSLIQVLFSALENNFVQCSLGTVKRDTLTIMGDDIARLLSRPAGAKWWERQGPRSFSPEFRTAIDRTMAHRDTLPDR